MNVGGAPPAGVSYTTQTGIAPDKMTADVRGAGRGEGRGVTGSHGIHFHKELFTSWVSTKRGVNNHIY